MESSGTIAATAAAVLLAGCVSPTGPEPGSIRAAYSLLAAAPDGGTVALARVIVDAGQPCPSLKSRAGPVAMTARGNPDPAQFPVAVCEALQPFGEEIAIDGAGIGLPTVMREPERIAVMGDTGCGTWQDCADPAVWPFARLAELAAGERPDLVIHVGDYAYRGTPGSIEVNGVKRGTYNAGNYARNDEFCQLRDPYVSQNAPGSSLPDSWEAWRIDFFAPAAPLLSRAPWVAARGNHELCSRAGHGYFYFLDPRSNLLGGELACPPQRQDSAALPNLVFAPPYRLDLGELRLLVMDSANACDQHPNLPDIFARQFADMAPFAAGKPAWLVTHRPIWGVDWLDSGTFQTSNVTLQDSLRASPGAALPAEVELVLSGHIHRFEALTFPDRQRPPQLVVGSSGISLETDELAGPFALELDGAPVRGLAVNAFAYLDAWRAPGGGWSARLVGTGAQTLVQCRSSEPGAAVCAPPAN